MIAITLSLAERLGGKEFCQNCLFVFLPFRWATAVTVAFRRHQRRQDLDHHFAFFCGPKLGKNVYWLRSSLVAAGYANEVWYYLYTSGHYLDALNLFPQLDWKRADEALLKALHECARAVASGYSMNLATQLHYVGWQETSKDYLAEYAKLVRKITDSQLFELEENVYRARAALRADLTHARIDSYVPYLFQNKSVIDELQSTLNLTPHPEIISERNSAGQYWEPFPHADAAEARDIACHYALRHLEARTYNNGEGAWVRTISEAAELKQGLIRQRMPAISRQLRSELERVGITELTDLRLLLPDWGAVIGHSGHLNVHLLMRELGWWSGSPLLFTYAEKIANRAFLSSMEDRCPIWILEENISSAVWHEVASLTPFVSVPHTFKRPDGRSMNWNDAGAMAVAEWERQGRALPLVTAYDSRPATHLTSERFERARRKWGIMPGDWYVCLHMRDAATRGNIEGMGESIRNTELQNYLDAIEHVRSMGGWIIRMGGPKAPPLPPMDRVIDYAHSVEKDAEMDIHLVRHAKMFIGTTSGFAYVASSLGVPSAMVDAISSMGLLWTKQTRFATKPVRTQAGRLLSLSELTSDRFRWALANFETLAEAGLTVESNTPDEILETVKEVLSLAFSKPPAPMPPAKWQAGFELPDFFGAASPSSYFLDKHPDLLRSPD
ncbi:TIGR04372 family glycosyltransferase [Bradyrhizobium sp. STM 3809]|uniref:TIGR04372 family glycosyltransferase n=1 Tax=Bradyrhizobium sp. STM 3809 TaxID=551936 RepID=UPI0014782747|nr:TIGR04372 family glycosyltransferase [Bradyrhizobium sp. STM 3809]